MREVEAQLVGADIGAGLAHVVPSALAQRGVEQVRGGVVGGGGVAGARSTACVDMLAALQLAPARARRRWPGRRRRARTSTTRAQSPSAQAIAPASEIWPPPCA